MFFPLFLLKLKGELSMEFADLGIVAYENEEICHRMYRLLKNLLFFVLFILLPFCLHFLTQITHNVYLYRSCEVLST